MTPPSKTKDPFNKKILLTLLLLGLFSALFIITFYPLFTDPHHRHWTTPGDDLLLQFAPSAYLMDIAIHSGELPLWNPLILCGVPFAANPQNNLFYPPNLLRSLLNFNPTPLNALYSIALLIAAHFLLLAISTFFFAKKHGLTNIPSLIASIAFCLSALSVNHGFHQIHFMYTIAWVPLILIALRNATLAPTPRQRNKFTLAAGLLYGIQMLEGTLQLTIYATVIYIAYFLLQQVLLPSEKPQAENPKPSTIIKETLKVLMPFVLIAVAIASAMWIPAAEFSTYSARSKSIAQPVERTHLWELPVYKRMKLVKNWSKDPPFKTFRNLASVIGPLLALHLSFLPCAVLALASSSRRTAFLFGLLFYVTFDYSMGPPFPIASLIDYFAPIQLGAPIYGAIFSGLPLSILAGLGVQAALKPPTTQRSKILRAVTILSTSALLYIAFLPYPTTLSVTNLSLTVLPIIVTFFLITAHYLPRAALAVLALAMFAETLIGNYTATAQTIERPDVLHATLAPFDLRNNNTRNIIVRPNLNTFTLQSIVNGYQPLQIETVNAVIKNPGLETKYSRAVVHGDLSTNPYATSFLKRPFWLVPNYIQGTLPPQKRPFPPTRYVFLNETENIPIEPTEPKTLPESFLSNQAQTIANFTSARVTSTPSLKNGKKHISLSLGIANLPPIHSAIKLAYTANADGFFRLNVHDLETDQRTVFGPFQFKAHPTQDKTLEWPLPDFERARITMSVELENPNADFKLTEVTLATDLADENRHIRILSYTANRVDLALIDLPDHRILAFIDAHYPGWQAYIDNEPVPILRANDAFKAVLVPPGTHQVTFIFRPKIVYFAAALSLLAAAITLGLLLAHFKIEAIPRGQTQQA